MGRFVKNECVVFEVVREAVGVLFELDQVLADQFDRAAIAEFRARSTCSHIASMRSR